MSNPTYNKRLPIPPRPGGIKSILQSDVSSLPNLPPIPARPETLFDKPAILPSPLPALPPVPAKSITLYDQPKPAQPDDFDFPAPFPTNKPLPKIPPKAHEASAMEVNLPNPSSIPNNKRRARSPTDLQAFLHFTQDSPAFDAPVPDPFPNPTTSTNIDIYAANSNNTNPSINANPNASTNININNPTQNFISSTPKPSQGPTTSLILGSRPIPSSSLATSPSTSPSFFPSSFISSPPRDSSSILSPPPNTTPLPPPDTTHPTPPYTTPPTPPDASPLPPASFFFPHPDPIPTPVPGSVGIPQPTSTTTGEDARQRLDWSMPYISPQKEYLCVENLPMGQERAEIESGSEKKEEEMHNNQKESIMDQYSQLVMTENYFGGETTEWSSTSNHFPNQERTNNQENESNFHPRFANYQAWEEEESNKSPRNEPNAAWLLASNEQSTEEEKELQADGEEENKEKTKESQPLDEFYKTEEIFGEIQVFKKKRDSNISERIELTDLQRTINEYLEKLDELSAEELAPPSYEDIDDDLTVDVEEMELWKQQELYRQQQETHLEEIEIDYGKDTLEECKMMIQWGMSGDLPPVPSRNDPSHQLSDEAAEMFIKQKDEIPDAYKLIMDDPRLIRLKEKYAPNFLTTKGIKQICKNQVDPATIPYIGLLFHVGRAANAKRNYGVMEKIIDTNQNEELKKTLETFKGGQVARGVQESAYVGVSAALMLLPVVDFIPGLSAQLMILGQVGTAAAEQSIEMGLKVVISKTSGQATEKIMASTEAFGGYGNSKAFIMYLGYPKNDDPLYYKWEAARCRLKKIFGVAAEDDVYKMRPKDHLLERIKQEEKMTGKPFTLEVPLLILLFRAYYCWDELYWDRLVKLKEKSKKKLGIKGLSIEERRRMRDYRHLRNRTAYLENIPPISPHLVILDESYKKEVVDILTESFLHSNHVSYLFSKNKIRSIQKPNLKWFMKMVVDYFFAHGAIFWGHVSTSKQLKAVAIWERPNESGKVSMISLLRTSGAVKLGANRWKLMSDILIKNEEFRQSEIRGLECWMLHWIGVHPLYQRQGIGSSLIKNCIFRHNPFVYLQLYDTEPDTISFFSKLCFVPVRSTENTPNFVLYNRPVNVVGYWYGIESPEELRAKLPPKKSFLQNFSTLRKLSNAGNLQLTNKLLAQQLLNTNEKLLLTNSEEMKLLKEAQQRYEEQCILLDNLKIDFAKLPTEDRENDPLAISLQSRIMEQQHLVDISKRSLDDANANIKYATTRLALTNS